jgi:hypothetical protein
MTWTSWGRPFYSRHCPQKLSKCGGEGCHDWGFPVPMDHSFQAQKGDIHCWLLPGAWVPDHSLSTKHIWLCDQGRLSHDPRECRVFEKGDLCPLPHHWEFPVP